MCFFNKFSLLPPGLSQGARSPILHPSAISSQNTCPLQYLITEESRCKPGLFPPLRRVSLLFGEKELQIIEWNFNTDHSGALQMAGGQALDGGTPTATAHAGLESGARSLGPPPGQSSATTTPADPGGRPRPAHRCRFSEATKTPLWVHRAPTSFLPLCAPLGTRTERQEAGDRLRADSSSDQVSLQCLPSKHGALIRASR